MKRITRRRKETKFAYRPLESSINPSKNPWRRIAKMRLISKNAEKPGLSSYVVIYRDVEDNRVRVTKPMHMLEARDEVKKLRRNFRF